MMVFGDLVIRDDMVFDDGDPNIKVYNVSVCRRLRLP